MDDAAGRVWLGVRRGREDAIETEPSADGPCCWGGHAVGNEPKEYRNHGRRRRGEIVRVVNTCGHSSSGRKEGLVGQE